MLARRKREEKYRKRADFDIITKSVKIKDRNASGSPLKQFVPKEYVQDDPNIVQPNTVRADGIHQYEASEVGEESIIDA